MNSEECVGRICEGFWSGVSFGSVAAEVKNFICYIQKLVRWLVESQRTSFCFFYQVVCQKLEIWEQKT